MQTHTKMNVLKDMRFSRNFYNTILTPIITKQGWERKLHDDKEKIIALLIEHIKQIS